MYALISRLSLLTLYLAALLFSTLPPASADVQFCKPNPPHLCLALSTYENTTSASHDFYLSLTFRRPTASPLGWTAVGIGSSMAGAVMIVVYGDPASSEPPTVSIRTATGHRQPTLLSAADELPALTGLASEFTRDKADIRVVRSVWEPSTDKAPQATISLLLYSRSVKSLLSTSQPWIWAVNPMQELSSFGPDANLNIHTSNGRFFVDMPRSFSPGDLPPDFPIIYPSKLNIGTSESPMWDKPSQPGTTTTSTLNPALRANLWHLHGLLMSISFLLLFPLGILAIASSSPRAFTYHWKLQLLASVFALLGITLAITLSTAIVLVHQYVGFLVAVLLFLQVTAGYRHHVLFLRYKHRTWISQTHIWLGRSVVVIGWMNLVAGMLRGGYGKLGIGAVELLMVLEMIVLVLWLVRKWTRMRKTAGEGGKGAPQIVTRGEDGEEYFALVGEGDEDGEEDEGKVNRE
ncbi:MAG: hypothetical protein Q9187_006482 [Circinaria calcarea]